MTDADSYAHERDHDRSLGGRYVQERDWDMDELLRESDSSNILSNSPDDDDLGTVRGIVTGLLLTATGVVWVVAGLGFVRWLLS